MTKDELKRRVFVAIDRRAEEIIGIAFQRSMARRELFDGCAPLST